MISSPVKYLLRKEYTCIFTKSHWGFCFVTCTIQTIIVIRFRLIGKSGHACILSRLRFEWCASSNSICRSRFAIGSHSRYPKLLSFSLSLFVSLFTSFFLYVRWNRVRHQLSDLHEYRLYTRSDDLLGCKVFSIWKLGIRLYLASWTIILWSWECLDLERWIRRSSKYIRLEWEYSNYIKS